METDTKNIKRNSRTITEEERKAFLKRFQRACKHKGITLQQLTVRIGKGHGYFNHMGYLPPQVESAVKKIIPDLNIDFINNGEGDMFIPLAEDLAKKREIPLLPISARAGTLTGFSEGVSDYECERIYSPVQGAQIAITVTGDSMEPEYPSGCVVFIKKINEKAFVEWGKTYVLDTCNGVVIKKLFPVDGDNSKFICRSVNSAYPDFVVKFTDVYGIYKVLLQMSLK